MILFCLAALCCMAPHTGRRQSRYLEQICQQAAFGRRESERLKQHSPSPDCIPLPRRSLYLPPLPLDLPADPLLGEPASIPFLGEPVSLPYPAPIRCVPYTESLAARPTSTSHTGPVSLSSRPQKPGLVTREPIPSPELVDVPPPGLIYGTAGALWIDVFDIFDPRSYSWDKATLCFERLCAQFATTPAGILELSERRELPRASQAFMYVLNTCFLRMIEIAVEGNDFERREFVTNIARHVICRWIFVSFDERFPAISARSRGRSIYPSACNVTAVRSTPVKEQMLMKAAATSCSILHILGREWPFLDVHIKNGTVRQAAVPNIWILGVLAKCAGLKSPHDLLGNCYNKHNLEKLRVAQSLPPVLSMPFKGSPEEFLELRRLVAEINR